MTDSKRPELKGVKKLFMKKGTCSQTFFHLLNREFGKNFETEERSADPFAGGIMQMGYQCGLLWGASMASGAAAYRRFGDSGKAAYAAIRTTRSLIESFSSLTGSPDCSDVTETDFSSKFEMLKFMIFKAHSCFGLAKKWAPEAVYTAKKELGSIPDDCPKALSCASETAKRMGATDEQAAMAAGMAGGMGLSGDACGALAAAIWMNTIAWQKANPGKSPYSNPAAKVTLEKFYKITGHEVICKNICGRDFNSIEEHTEYVRNGGCREIIEGLAVLKFETEKIES